MPAPDAVSVLPAAMMRSAAAPVVRAMMLTAEIDGSVRLLVEVSETLPRAAIVPPKEIVPAVTLRSFTGNATVLLSPTVPLPALNVVDQLLPNIPLFADILPPDVVMALFALRLKKDENDTFVPAVVISPNKSVQLKIKDALPVPVSECKSTTLPPRKVTGSENVAST